MRPVRWKGTMDKPTSFQSKKISEAQSKTMTRRKWLKRSLLGLAGVCLAEALSEPGRLSFETLEVPVQGLADAFDGYRIALFSDLHYPRVITPAYVQRAVALANKFRPDLL